MAMTFLENPRVCGTADATAQNFSNHDVYVHTFNATKNTNFS